MQCLCVWRYKAVPRWKIGLCKRTAMHMLCKIASCIGYHECLIIVWNGFNKLAFATIFRNKLWSEAA